MQDSRSKERIDMNITESIIKWLKTCPDIGNINAFDINLLQGKKSSVGLFKQPSVTVTEFIDGSKQITEYYYFLFKRAAQVKADRLSNEEYLRTIEDWIDEQEFKGNYPNIGYPVDGIGMSDGYYMVSMEEKDATYQLTLEIQYRKEVTNG